MDGAGPVEQPLEGGNVGGASRLGDRVLRPAGPWTAAVQRLLGHLRAAGLDWVPEPLGTHPDGREVVGHLDGDVPGYPLPAWVWTEDNLELTGRRLRELHEATADYADPDACWHQQVRQPAEVVCHNDFAPYNMVFTDGRLSGVIDFDMASPGPRIWDLAYLAYRVVPLTAPGNPDGLENHADRTARLSRLVEAYGASYSTAEVLEAVVARLEHLIAFTRQHAAESGGRDLATHVELYTADLAHLEALLAAERAA